MNGPVRIYETFENKKVLEERGATPQGYMRVYTPCVRGNKTSCGHTHTHTHTHTHIYIYIYDEPQFFRVINMFRSRNES